MNLNRLLFIKNKKLPLRMHHNAPQLKRIQWYCMQDNQKKLLGDQIPDKTSHWIEG